MTGLDVKIKWPNDLLIGGRKAAGILAESAIVGNSVWYAVLGVGMNVSLDTKQIEEISPSPLASTPPQVKKFQEKTYYASFLWIWTPYILP
ncbi:MAG: hypothetical protein Ct9H300mP11_19320 [Chloroflexota bacterium]|nr:MAG: hypothetical protein Ct9H300mP11_19320 [Chloroflexota bacterium]